MEAEENPRQQLQKLLKGIVQQLNDDPSDELREAFNQFVNDMPEAERLCFIEEMLAVNGWQKVDESQWPSSEELIQVPMPVKEKPSLNELVPPWAKYPDIPCYSIGWRMGSGEHYMLTWMEAIGGCDVNTRIAYFKKHLPVPVSWLIWVASYCGCGASYTHTKEDNFKAVQRLEDLGLADFTEFKTWFEDKAKKSG